MRSIVCAVALLPALRTAGSPPGITWKMKNVKTEMAKRTSTIDSSRLTMKRATLVLLHPDLRPRVQRVAHTVAEHVQREHGEHEHETGHDREVRAADDLLHAVADHVAPGGRRRPHA